MTAEPTPSPRYMSPTLTTRGHHRSRMRAFMAVTKCTASGAGCREAAGGGYFATSVVMSFKVLSSGTSV
jgi:hypothetical protein